MPTVLRSFPEISRVGHQETGWSAPIPASIHSLRLEGVASDAVFSDLTKSMDIVILLSPDGTDATQQEAYREHWTGGTHGNKTGGMDPNRIDVGFGPLEQYVGWRVKLSVDIPVAMVLGATVTSLP